MRADLDKARHVLAETRAAIAEDGDSPYITVYVMEEATPGEVDNIFDAVVTAAEKTAPDTADIVALGVGSPLTHTDPDLRAVMTALEQLADAHEALLAAGEGA